jgi:serine protease AprX
MALRQIHLNLTTEYISYATLNYFIKANSPAAIICAQAFSMSLITINGNSFDPEAPAVRSLGLNMEDVAITDYILIQTTGEPLKKTQKTELNETGVKIQEYVGNDTYLCSYKDKFHLNTLRQLSYVKYANVYLQEFVVQPSLKTAPDPSAIAIGLAVTPKTRISKTIDIVLHNDVQASQGILKAIAGAAHVDADELCC